MFDTKIYKATVFVALIAVVVALFSLDTPPRSYVAALAPDAFDDARAARSLRRIAREYPDRRPGSDGNRALAELIEARLASLGYMVTRQEFKESASGRGEDMSNIIGELSGDSDREVVVMAPRDADRPDGGVSGVSGTAALLELAVDLVGVEHDKTFILVSTDGSTSAAAGARAFADGLKEAEKVDGVIVLGDLDSERLRQPFVVPWSDTDVVSPPALVRTAKRAVRSETGTQAAGTGIIGQLVRLSFPLALQEQGVLLSARLPAVTLSSHGELPAPPAGGDLDLVARKHFKVFGKSALSTLLALDGAEPLDRSPDRYLSVAGRVVPGWAVSVLVLALIVPVLFVAVDAFARARWRRVRIAPWVGRLLLRALPFIVFLLGAYLFVWLGLLPKVSAGAFDPGKSGLSIASALAWSGLVIAAAAVFLYAQRLVGHGAEDSSASITGSAVALALVLTAAALALWLINPFAAAMLLPPLHLWVLAAQVKVPARRLVLPLMIAAGLAGPALVIVYYLLAFDLGVGAANYFGLLFAGRAVGPFQALIACVVAGCFLSASWIVRARLREDRQGPTITTRGPVTYAGPGSLGGTEASVRLR